MATDLGLATHGTKHTDANGNVAGHTFAFNVVIPGLLVFGLLITGLALHPFFERWVTGDKNERRVDDRPRNAPAGRIQSADLAGLAPPPASGLAAPARRDIARRSKGSGIASSRSGRFAA